MKIGVASAIEPFFDTAMAKNKKIINAKLNFNNTKKMIQTISQTGKH